MRTRGKAGHFPGHGWLHAHIEQHQPSLQYGEDADQAIGLHPKILDVQRDKGNTHQRLPAYPEVVGDDVFLQRHCGDSKSYVWIMPLSSSTHPVRR